MTDISEDLIRKKAEHNNCEISTLEELSLHQSDIIRIKYIDKWCRELKILYLQSNLISKIENVGRLKKLEYLNLALNNVELIENLEGCESLKKLDLTVNFVGKLTSIESLRSLEFLRDLYLVGNPCADFEHYREYVIATLPQLKYLDGKEIERSERIVAEQQLGIIRPQILEQEREYLRKRANQKQQSEQGASENGESKQFWEEKVPFTPESRVEVHDYMKKQRERDAPKEEAPPPPPRRLFASDERPLNANEAKLDFQLTDNEAEHTLVLDLSVPRFLDTDSLSLDVQPAYVRCYVRGKVFQLVLTEEVLPDGSRARRSQTTGTLQITMPKARDLIRPVRRVVPSKSAQTAGGDCRPTEGSVTALEVDPSVRKDVNFGNIVAEGKLATNSADRTLRGSGLPSLRPDSPGFVDDPDVPPLI